MNSVLKTRKRISYFEQSNNGRRKITVYIEQVLDAAYGCYIWPSALVMSEFLFYSKANFLNKTILEVGAGTCLPSLTILKSTKPAHVIITDIESILPIVHDCLKLNNVHQEALVSALEWGSFGTPQSIDYLIKNTVKNKNTVIDYIIGSDTFYEPSEFENLLVLISYVIHQHNPSCVFLTTYQERSPKRTIQYLLDKWGLQCRLIPKESFDFDELKYTEKQDTESEIKVNSGILSSVFLLEITRAVT
ncbi:putative methyltransferase-domain-containing protein [Sporodiniella umbellata]|nr:putative methyltransferase-domain-containing protein [Sporodiniella umbellata]